MSNEPRAGNGLDPELLAAYIDKRLTPEQRRRVEAQLANDPDNYAVLVETMKALDATTASPARAKDSRRWMPAASALAAAAVIALAVWMSPAIIERFRGETVDPRFERLVAAVGEERYLEPRLTGGFRYGRLRSPMRAGAPDLSQQNLTLLAAAGELQKAAQDEPSSENLHYWGIAQLQLGQYDGAIEALRRAAQSDDSSGRIRSDLAAALIARGIAGNTKDLADAVQVLQPVLDLPSPPREALFNRALVLERLGLIDAAIDAWTRAIEAEAADPAWRSEAEAHRTGLMQRRKVSREQQWLELRAKLIAGDTTAIPLAFDQFSQESRELLEDVLIPQFGRSCVVAAAADCASVRRTVESLAERRASDGDRLAMDAVKRLDELARDNPKAAARLVDAHTLYGRAREQFEGTDPVASGTLFMSAGKTFSELRSPFEYWARNYSLSVDYFSGRYDVARTGADQLLTTITGRSYPLITGRTNWLRGLVAFIQSDFEQARADYDAAIDIFAQAHETGNATFLRVMQCETDAYLGILDEQWPRRISTVMNVETVANVRRRHSLLLSASSFSLRSGNVPIAGLFADAAVRNAATSSLPALIAEAALQRARALYAANRFKDARDSLIESWSALANTPPSIANRMRAEVMLTESEISMTSGESRPEMAAEAGTYLKGLGADFRLPAVERLRARMALAEGNVSQARDHYLEALSLSKQQRERLTQQHRLSFADESWDLLEEAAAAERRSGATPSDTLSFIDAYLNDADAWGSATVPARVARIRFLVLRDETLAVVRTPAATTDFAFSVHRTEIEGLAQRFAQSARTTPISDDIGKRLWKMLLAPLEKHLADIDTLYIVPDGPLYQVPFAAMLDESGQALINRFALVIASPRMATANASAVARRSLFVLPSEETADGKGLPSLPAARVEVEDLAKRYPGALILRDDVTAAALEREAERSTLVHFAGHAEANALYPANSWLQIGGPNRGRLFAYQVQKWQLASNAVVILAACSTGQGRVSRTEGALSLANAFLSAGARSVIATSWQVPDREARLMSNEIHDGLQSGLSPERALQRAQLRRIAAGDPPNVWLAFGVYSRIIQPTVHSTN